MAIMRSEIPINLLNDIRTVQAFINVGKRLPATQKSKPLSLWSVFDLSRAIKAMNDCDFFEMTGGEKPKNFEKIALMGPKGLYDLIIKNTGKIGFEVFDKKGKLTPAAIENFPCRGLINMSLLDLFKKINN